MKSYEKPTVQVLVLTSIAGYVGFRTYSDIRRGQGAGSSKLVRSSRQYTAVQVSDTGGRQLHSLFDRIPVDPRYSKYAHPPKVTACHVRSTAQRTGSRLLRAFEGLGFSFNDPVYAQGEPCNCGEDAQYSACAEECAGVYWGGPTSPSDDPDSGFTWEFTSCTPYNHPQCTPEPHPDVCSCQVGDDPP
jgi:hypothetical protein